MSPIPSQANNDGASFLCSPVANGGIYYNEQSKKWSGTSFSTSTELFTIQGNYQGNGSDERYPFQIIKMGEKYPSGYCEQGFSDAGWLLCQSFGPFYFSRETMRYMSFYNFGYLDGVDNNDNTPVLEVGECVQIN